MHSVIEQLYSINPILKDRILYLTLHGSKSYGTNIEGSDDDYKGIVSLPKEYYLGFQKRFEQQELNKPDTVVFNITKFFSLASVCNPNTIEILFTDPSDHIFVSKLGEKILDAKDKFLSKRIRYTFAGYANSQLKRIKLHRNYLLSPPKEKPSREEFNLPPKSEFNDNNFSIVKKEVEKDIEKYYFAHLDFREDQIIAIRNSLADILSELKYSKSDIWEASAKKLGLADNLIEYLQRERAYEGKLREYNQYVSWKKNRNPERAKLEEQFFFDTKHAMHLVRLLRLCREILATGKVLVKRPDAKELIAIRKGAWKFDYLLEYAEKENATLDEICAKSNIQDKPDMQYLDTLCVDIVHNSF